MHAVIAPLFERGFIDHTYANRVGKGTHRAVARYESLRDRYKHVLHGDVYRYFPGTVTRRGGEQRVRAWVAHAAHADTWRLRRAIFRDGWVAPRGRPVPGA